MAAPRAVLDQPKVQVSHRTCEKSCQVSSEQIKADMKAAAENRTENPAEPEPGLDGSSVTSRTRTRPSPGSVNRVTPAAVKPFREEGNTSRNTTDRAVGPVRSSDRWSGQAGWRQRGNGSESSCGSSDPWLQDVYREPAPGPGSVSGLDPQQSSSSQDFTPRRPLTRSCTRSSSVPLLPETGKTGPTPESDVTVSDEEGSMSVFLSKLFWGVSSCGRGQMSQVQR